MDPIYFARSLSLYEAEAYIRGLDRRQYSAWMQARYIAFYAAAPHCSKDFTFEKMGKFAWERREEGQEPELNAEERERELEALRARSDELDKRILTQL